MVGTATGAVTEGVSARLTATGTLSVTDPDAGEAVFIVQTGTVATYGAFSLTTAGVWTYTADSAQAAIQSLGAGTTLTDSFTATTADGTTQVVTVTINGIDEPFKVELSDIETGSGGFVINGVAAFEQSGRSVSGAGDVIDLSAFGIADFAGVTALVSAEGPGGHDSRITLDSDTVVILEGIQPSVLVASNVIL